MSIDEYLRNDGLDKTEESSNLRKEILNLVEKYYQSSHSNRNFVPGQTTVPVAGRVYDDLDIKSLVSSSLDFWLTTGRFNNEFEKQLATFLGISEAITTNSGSSANLLALTSLTSNELKDDAILPGDEVITVAAGFPTTINPIIQNGLVPVFVDIEIPTYVIDHTKIESAITDKTKAIMLAHTLGNPFNIDKIVNIAKKHDLWLIEDCCDALGSTYDSKQVGTFGDLSTLSFYPAHHITMGEGGAVLTNNGMLKRLVESFRDWGRDCFCATGMSNTCGKRFEWELGELPVGYDHKYIYSHIGYNLKITDMQAAVGLAQLQKLPEFIRKRKNNFSYLKEKLSEVTSLILPKPTAKSDPSWFGFPITIADDATFTREDLIFHLIKNKIDTRPIFAGNMIRQPAFANIHYRTPDSLTNTDLVMKNSFWIGVFPGLNETMLDYVSEKIIDFVKSN